MATPERRVREFYGFGFPDEFFRKLSADPFAAGAADLNAAQVKALAGEALGLLTRGYPGAALKLGHDLWVWGEQYPACYELLDAAYAALGREPLRRLLAEARAFRQHCD